MTSLALLLVLRVGATEPPDDGDYEVIVYGQLLVEQARQELVHELEQEGYALAKDKGDHVVYRHAQPWKGEVLVYDDGWVRVRRQRPHVEPVDAPFLPEGSPLSWAACAVVPWRCVRIGGWTVSGRKYQAQQSRVVVAMEDEATVYGDRVADLAVDRAANDLPERLEALWYEGVPLRDGDPVLVTPADRRAALLDYWEERTCTPWGDTMRDAVEAFLRAEVQTSEHPVTVAELADLDARCRCPRSLDLGVRDTESLAAP